MGNYGQRSACWNSPWRSSDCLFAALAVASFVAGQEDEPVAIPRASSFNLSAPE